MKKWNFGIIGAGVIADFHALAIKDINRANLVGVCDIIEERASDLAKKYSCKAYNSFDELLSEKEIDIVTIATPSGAHAAPTVAAAEMGKHVICEKPLEITLQRIDDMIDAHNQAGTRLGGIFQNRFTDALVPIREALEAKRFGVVTYAGAYVPWWRTEEYYKDSWHGSWDMDGGGALMNQSIHMIDMLCWLMGPVASLQAFANNIGHPQIEAEDTAVAVLKFASGTLGMIYGSTASFPGQLKRLEITGTKGTAILVEDSFTAWQFEEEKPQDEQIRQKFAKTSAAGAVADPVAMSHEKHTLNIESFLKSLEQNSKFEIDGVEARKSVELIQAIYRSAKEQRIIKLT